MLRKRSTLNAILRLATIGISLLLACWAIWASGEDVLRWVGVLKPATN
jgi:hypothetical protein